MTARKGYSALQIGLHWVIAVLVLAAYITSDGMGRALRARIDSGAGGFDGNTVHVWLGGVVFLLVLVRIFVRLRSGAPEAPERTPPLVARAAHWGHRLIYALMVAVPALGAVSWYGGVRAAGEVHETAGNVFMLIVLGHALAAIGHEAFLRDGTMARMFAPRR